MSNKLISCCFVVLYEHGSKKQLMTTLDSVTEFAQQYFSDSNESNPFNMVVVVGDRKKVSHVEIKESIFSDAKVLDRSCWDLPGEKDFGPFPVIFNLANIALKRAFLTVMMLPCGCQIINPTLAEKALLKVYRNDSTAVLSASLGENGDLAPNGIIFNNVPGWSNLSTAMEGDVVTVRKSFFGGVRCQKTGKVRPAAYSDKQLIGAIAYDYQRNRHGYGEKVVLSQWANDLS